MGGTFSAPAENAADATPRPPAPNPLVVTAPALVAYMEFGETAALHRVLGPVLNALRNDAPAHPLCRDSAEQVEAMVYNKSDCVIALHVLTACGDSVADAEVFATYVEAVCAVPPSEHLGVLALAQREESRTDALLLAARVRERAWARAGEALVAVPIDEACDDTPASATREVASKAWVRVGSQSP